MKNLTTSVVVGTYNGAQFIKEQLQSIFNQTQKVDEVFIFDDRSTDETVEICEKFIKDKALINWTLTINKEQLGVFHNFINGALACKGDIIFFADQDDIWLENKVAVMVNEFEKNKELLSLTSTFSRFNENIVLSEHVKHPNRKRNNLIKVNFINFCNFPYYLGMSMAISKDLLSLTDFKKDIVSDITHDIYLNFFSVLNNGLFYLDIVLTKRRSYSESVSNKKFTDDVKIYSNGNKRLHTVFDKINLLELFKSKLKSSINNDTYLQKRNMKIIEKHLLFNNLRHQFLKNKSILSWGKSIIYLKFYNSFLSYMLDGIEIVKTNLK